MAVDDLEDCRFLETALAAGDAAGTRRALASIGIYAFSADCIPNWRDPGIEISDFGKDVIPHLVSAASPRRTLRGQHVKTTPTPSPIGAMSAINAYWRPISI